MITFEEAVDVHPDTLVTVKVYVPAARPETVVLVPVPVVVAPPGERVRVHSPDAGRLLRATLPVATVHVGWVMLPTAGAVGLALTVRV